MNVQSRVMALLAVATALLSQSCKVVEGIFRAGVWTGIFGLVLLFALIGGTIALFRRS